MPLYGYFSAPKSLSNMTQSKFKVDLTAVPRKRHLGISRFVNVLGTN